MTQSKELKLKLANQCANDRRRIRQYARDRNMSPGRLMKFYAGELSLTPAEITKGLS